MNRRQTIKKKLSCVLRQKSGQRELLLDSSKELLWALREKKVPLAFSCGGEGICTTCRILVHKGELSPPNALELQQIKDRSYKDNERLACQIFALSDKIEIEIP